MPRKTATPVPHHTTRGEQTRLRITQAAAELVHRHGFHHTSLDDILVAAKVPKGSLYFYFQNKEELGFAIIRYRRDFLLSALHDIFSQPGLLLQHIRQWFAFMRSTQKMGEGCLGCPVGNLAQELSREGDAFAKEIDQFFVQAQTILSTRLKRAQQDGELSLQTQPKEIGRFLLMASQGALLMAKTRNSLVPLREAEKMVLQFLGSFAPEKKIDVVMAV